MAASELASRLGQRVLQSGAEFAVKSSQARKMRSPSAATFFLPSQISGGALQPEEPCRAWAILDCVLQRFTSGREVLWPTPVEMGVRFDVAPKCGVLPPRRRRPTSAPPPGHESPPALDRPTTGQWRRRPPRRRWPPRRFRAQHGLAASCGRPVRVLPGLLRSRSESQ